MSDMRFHEIQRLHELFRIGTIGPAQEPFRPTWEDVLLLVHIGPVKNLIVYYRYEGIVNIASVSQEREDSFSDGW